MRKERVEDNFRGIGDCKLARGHYSYGVILESEREAQEIADRICDEFGEKRWNVFFHSSNARRLMGTANRSYRRIRLYPAGRNAGVLLHELAHEYGRHHDSEFKAYQSHILRAFEKLYPYSSIQSLRTPRADWSDVPIVTFTFPAQPAIPAAPAPAAPAPAPYVPDEGETDDILETVVDMAIESASGGIVSALFIHRMLKEWGVSNGANYNLVRELVETAGVRVAV
jgi:hypothetical protein